MKKNKGQVIVEFAVVLPLFLLVLFGIIYSGMLFYDYSSLSNLARSAAREAAITQNANYTNIAGEYNNFVTGANGKNQLITSLYIPDSEQAFSVTHDSTTDSVGVTITMKRNTASTLMKMVLPEEYKIEYYMKRDEQSTPPASG